jgi:hypothetical protein
MMNERQWIESADSVAKGFSDSHEETCEELGIDTSSTIKEEALADVWYVPQEGAEQYLGTLDLINPNEFRDAHLDEMQLHHFRQKNPPIWLDSPNFGQQLISWDNLKIVRLQNINMPQDGDDDELLDDIR